MSLVAASISAMSAAPSVMAENMKSDNVENKNIIKLNVTNSDNIDPAIKEDLENQVNAILAKKAPITKMSESISILVDNYGDDNGSIKENIYKELNLGFAPQVVDSTSFDRPGISNPPLKSHVGSITCHTACHSACHSACHGSRGWR